MNEMRIIDNQEEQRRNDVGMGRGQIVMSGPDENNQKAQNIFRQQQRKNMSSIEDEERGRNSLA
jgi:hypothetical protein